MQKSHNPLSTLHVVYDKELKVSVLSLSTQERLSKSRKPQSCAEKQLSQQVQSLQLENAALKLAFANLKDKYELLETFLHITGKRHRGSNSL
jgi:hypothetical protein